MLAVLGRRENTSLSPDRALTKFQENLTQLLPDVQKLSPQEKRIAQEWLDGNYRENKKELMRRLLNGESVYFYIDNDTQKEALKHYFAQRKSEFMVRSKFPRAIGAHVEVLEVKLAQDPQTRKSNFVERIRQAGQKKEKLDQVYPANKEHLDMAEQNLVSKWLNSSANEHFLKKNLAEDGSAVLFATDRDPKKNRAFFMAMAHYFGQNQAFSVRDTVILTKGIPTPALEVQFHQSEVTLNPVASGTQRTQRETPQPRQTTRQDRNAWLANRPDEAFRPPYGRNRNGARENGFPQVALPDLNLLDTAKKEIVSEWLSETDAIRRLTNGETVMISTIYRNKADALYTYFQLDENKFALEVIDNNSNTSQYSFTVKLN